MKRYTNITTTNRADDLWIKITMYIFDNDDARERSKEYKLTREQKDSLLKRLGKPTGQCGLWGGGRFLVWDRKGYEYLNK